ncbi:MAG: DUF2993 domain-containing protein [Actinobacteria bacterium]|nr:DUF2993 domain-containing protein [Actinomycetota bacterium]
MTGDAQPTLPFPEGWQDAAPRRRRSVVPWLVALVVVVGLAVAAWFIGESIARDLVTKTIREQVVSRLALPADQQIDVSVGGAVLPQLIVGTLDDVTVSSPDVAWGSVSGDVTVHAHGVAIRGEVVPRSIDATVSLNIDQLRALLSTVDGFPAESVGLAAPDVTISTSIKALGLSVPVGVALTPSASNGALVLTPDTLQLAGAQISAAELRGRFGALADAVLRDWTVCVAKDIPAGVSLTGVTVVGDAVVADLAIDGRIATDATLRANGSCA